MKGRAEETRIKQQRAEALARRKSMKRYGAMVREMGRKDVQQKGEVMAKEEALKEVDYEEGWFDTYTEELLREMRRYERRFDGQEKACIERWSKNDVRMGKEDKHLDLLYHQFTLLK